MTSPYLARPHIPLAEALPRMLEGIETDLADETLGATEKWQLRQRAGLLRQLFTPSRQGQIHALGPAGAAPPSGKGQTLLVPPGLPFPDPIG